MEESHLAITRIKDVFNSTGGSSHYLFTPRSLNLKGLLNLKDSSNSFTIQELIIQAINLKESLADKLKSSPEIENEIEAGYHYYRGNN